MDSTPTPLMPSAPRLPGDLPPVLIVDDDGEILTVLKELLKQEGYHVDICQDPHQALPMLEGRKYCCIISDQYMPGMAGLDLLNAAQAIQPNATRILLTGQATLQVALDAINKGDLFRFVRKPWAQEDLTTTISNAVSRYLLLEENEALHRETRALNLCLKEVNEALSENFSQSISLCHSIMGTYHPLLGAFTRSVEAICQRICETEVLNEEEQKVLMLSASLHNIGLVGIPRDILTTAFRQSGQLSQEQRYWIEKHPVYGQTLAGFVGHLKGVGETIRAHHERWDGKGYPDGLAEKAIPRPARFLAVVAAYVESGLPHGEAIEYLIDQSNRAFAPEAVRVFLQVARATTLPRKVREMTTRELRSGMVLAKNLYSPTGLLLLHEGQVLKPELLEKIRDHDILDHVRDRLLVYL